MADNVTFQSATLATPPDGTKVSADENVTSGLVQRFKLAYSADGLDTHVTADVDGLLVNLGTNNDVVITSCPATAVEDAASAGGETGQYILAVRQDTPASTTSADGDFSSLKVDAFGRQWVREAAGSTGTRTQVADSATDVSILAANQARIGATVYNDSSAYLVLGLGTTAVTATNYSVRVFPNGYYEVPATFKGELRGLWASDPNDGAARVTEW